MENMTEYEAPHYDGNIAVEIEKHEEWLETEGREGERAGLGFADLRNANLRYANLYDAGLRRANLRHADLRNANLRYADLYDAGLRRANLRHADLRNTDLRYANLYDAGLRRANLRHADLRNTDLRHADLWDADLQDADLRDADLQDANLEDSNLWDADLGNADLEDANFKGAGLRNADLRHANLKDADLRNADLKDANLEDAQIGARQIVPETGPFEAYKATQNHIVRLWIPASADRLSALTSRKCRAEYVETLEILDENGEPCDATEARGRRDTQTVYREGEITEADGWDDDRRVECSHGIHFFVTKQEAKEWKMNMESTQDAARTTRDL